MNKKYKYLYFDLDQTLWDFKSNSEIVLKNLCVKFFKKEIPNPQEFLDIYYPINDQLWDDYRHGKIVKAELRIKRFEDALLHFDISDTEQVETFCDEYLMAAPQQTGLMPHTHEVLTYLKNKGYRMFLLTNGFKEVQVTKIKANNLEQYFEQMITSDEAGYQKPNRKIFEYALTKVNAKKSQSLMIGDDLNTDILGANQFGMDAVFYNYGGSKHDSKVMYEIESLQELKEFL